MDTRGAPVCLWSASQPYVHSESKQKHVAARESIRCVGLYTERACCLLGKYLEGRESGQIFLEGMESGQIFRCDHSDVGSESSKNM